MEPTKKEDISHMLKELKDLKNEMEMSLGGELLEIVKCNRGFSFDFSVLVGGVVDVIEKAKSDLSDPRVIAGWKLVGEKVRKSRNKVLPPEPDKSTTSADVSAS